MVFWLLAKNNKQAPGRSVLTNYWENIQTLLSGTWPFALQKSVMSTCLAKFSMILKDWELVLHIPNIFFILPLGVYIKRVQQENFSLLHLIKCFFIINVKENVSLLKCQRYILSIIWQLFIWFQGSKSSFIKQTDRYCLIENCKYLLTITIFY